jgi:hypothetical protein
MFGGGLGFFAARAPAAVDGGVAVDLFQEGIPAIADAAPNDAHGAALAHLGSLLPLGMDFLQSGAAQAGAGEALEGASELTKAVRSRNQRGHMGFYRPGVGLGWTFLHAGVDGR